MQMREVEELAEYRSLMEAPGEFRDGFNLKTILGALFIGLVMMPGSIYLGLVVGQSMGPAAEWTTIILFTEVARRSFAQLSKQEVYVLYYIAGGLTAMVGQLALSGGPFAGLIWAQFLRSATRSPIGSPRRRTPKPSSCARSSTATGSLPSACCCSPRSSAASPGSRSATACSV
jgi:hypothetical protein